MDAAHPITIISATLAFAQLSFLIHKSVMHTAFWARQKQQRII
jgi:hypothetical protein